MQMGVKQMFDHEPVVKDIVKQYLSLIGIERGGIYHNRLFRFIRQQVGIHA
jgi:hypothetical protein